MPVSGLRASAMGILLLNVTKSSSRDASGRLNASRPGQAARI